MVARIAGVATVDATRRKPFARVVMCNPQLLSSSDETVTAWETCLSEPLRIGLVSRPRRITMAFQDPNGMHHTLDAADWVARILCHEADHLDGCLCSRRYRPDSAMQTTAYVNEWRNRPLSDALAYFAGQGVR